MADLDTEKITDSGESPSTPNILIIGGGMCGLLTSMLLADDGYAVTVLERDPDEPPAAVDAWYLWERDSVRQFHMGHFFLPRFRNELAANLPRLIESMAAIGALSFNPIKDMPDDFSGGWQEGDERFEALTGRRPVIEAVVAAEAKATSGVTIRRGVTVSGLLTSENGETSEDTEHSENSGNPPHIIGVETADGETLYGDLVVDTTGRNSALPRLLTAAGAKTPVDESDDSGFVYYGRTFRSADGSLPVSIGGGLQEYESISTLTLAADNGTWQIAFVASGRDKAMRRVRDEDSFNELWRSYPLVAHWVDGEPLSDVEMMANLEDRIRHFVVDGTPVVTGLAAVGDSWACTNPSVGRGASMGLLHALALRDHLRAVPLDDPVAWSIGWDRRTSETVEPYYRETVRSDRLRLAQIEAEIDGGDYDSDDRSFQFLQALPAAAVKDPAIMRIYLEIFMMLRLVDETMADEQMVERVIQLGSEAEAAPGPSRTELEAMLA